MPKSCEVTLAAERIPVGDEAELRVVVRNAAGQTIKHPDRSYVRVEVSGPQDPGHEIKVRRLRFVFLSH